MIARYACFSANGDLQCEKDPNGEWMKSEDVQKFLAEYEEKIQSLENLLDELQENQS